MRVEIEWPCSRALPRFVYKINDAILKHYLDNMLSYFSNAIIHSGLIDLNSVLYLLA